MSEHYIPDSPFSQMLFSNRKTAWLWLIVRVYVGWQWLSAGYEKMISPDWIGPNAGQALAGFIKGALAKATGTHPDVQGWYASFLQNVVLAHVHGWSTMVTFGEVFVGLGLIIGLLTGIAAFFGLFMNLNFLMAGTVSVNPILFVLSIGIILAWRVAGHLGLDRYVLPLLGVPWKPGELFKFNKS
jgi:thiosulfate dehydrogenase [quinone] large subunit